MFSIHGLNKTVKYEFRAFLFSAIATILYLIDGQETSAMVVAMVGIVPAALMDLVFTIVISVIFLNPLFDILRLGKGRAKNHASRKLERVKYRTIIGGDCF
jgi:hypothetical protein